MDKFHQIEPQPSDDVKVARNVGIVVAKRRASRGIQLADLVLAKIDLNQVGPPRLIVVVDVYQVETRKIEVSRLRKGNRKQTAMKNGKEGELEQTVQVPMVEEREINVYVPTGKKPRVFDLDLFRFFDLDANSLDPKEAAKKLSGLGPVFLLDYSKGTPRAPSNLLKKALNPHCLILVTGELIRKDGLRAIAQPEN